MKKIPRPELPDAKVLTALEMNDMHFTLRNRHTPRGAATEKPKK